MKNSIDFTIELFKERKLLNNMEDNVNIIFEQIKKKEINDIIDNKKSKKEIKIDLYKNIYNNL